MSVSTARVEWGSIVRRDERTDRNVYGVQHAWPSNFGPALCGARQPDYTTVEDTEEPRCKRCRKVWEASR